MGTIEYIIWHVLGYAAMPIILIAGFIAVSLVSLWLLSLKFDKKEN